MLPLERLHRQPLWSSSALSNALHIRVQYLAEKEALMFYGRSCTIRLFDWLLALFHLLFLHLLQPRRY